MNPEATYGEKTKTNTRCEQHFDCQNGSQPNLRAHDMVTGEKESPTQVPEFLTGRMPSRNHLNQSYDDLILDMTIQHKTDPPRP